VLGIFTLANQPNSLLLHTFYTVRSEAKAPPAGANSKNFLQKMMKHIMKLGMVAVALFMFSSLANAQKFGYVNSALILKDLPEMKQFQSTMESFQKQLEKQGESKLTAFQQKQQAAAQKKQQGLMTPKEEEEVTAELQKMQQELYDYSAQMDKDLADRQQKEMQPILDKVNTAIQDVAKEGSFQYIFDAQSGVILYADESTDVTALVKTKLGI
jgi:outer membrane protein